MHIVATALVIICNAVATLEIENGIFVNTLTRVV